MFKCLYLDLAFYVGTYLSTYVPRWVLLIPFYRISRRCQSPPPPPPPPQAIKLLYHSLAQFPESAMPSRHFATIQEIFLWVRGQIMCWQGIFTINLIYEKSPKFTWTHALSDVSRCCYTHLVINSAPAQPGFRLNFVARGAPMTDFRS